MYHDDTIGLAAMREQFKKDEALRGPAEGARGKPTGLRRPTPRADSCDSVALDVAGALKPPFFTREALEAHDAAHSTARSARQPASARPSARSARQPSARSNPPVSARPSARLTTARSAVSSAPSLPQSQKSYAGHHIHVPPPQSARSEDVLETVRSDWATARVERKYAKLQKEKNDILQRIAEVDAQLEKERPAEHGYGRRRRHEVLQASRPTDLHP